MDGGHPGVSFGVKTSQSGLRYADIVELWRQADELDVIEHAWLWDHMVPLRGEVTGDTLEAWTLLAALAAQTRRLRLGIIVTSNRLRPPALLAKMAATVDVISGGRLQFGIGAGGSRVADSAVVATVEREYGAYGIDVVAPGEALGALGEACTIARRLWTETEPFDFDGRWYRLRGAVCEPKPVQRPHPPVLIGAGGERTGLRVVAEHADIWNCPTRGDVEEFARKSAVLDAHCLSIGRDPSEIVRSVQVLVATDPSSHLGEPPAEVRARVVDLVTAGVSHVVLAPLPPLPPARWLVDEIIDPVLARLG